MKTETIEICRRIQKEEEGSYFLIPFLLPEEADWMEIHYSYEKEGNVIDLGMMNSEEEFIGWSGSNRDSIILSDWCPSSGFAKTALKPGTWNILAGAYHVQEGGVTVSYRITLHPKKRMLLKGDTHAHSCGSDGDLTVSELAQMAKSQKLDYLFVTDHNNYAHNDLLCSDGQLTMIPGVEWTHYLGHANFLGVRRPFKKFIANSAVEAEAIIGEAKENGALIVRNHPYCSFCGWKWEKELPYDLIELWNGALMIENNLKCLNWWDARLKEGERIPVIGGSDFHKTEPGRMLALPCTCLYSRSRSQEDILEALRNGNGFITFSPDGPLMQVENETIVPGDEVSPRTQIALSFDRLKAGDKIILIDREGERQIHREEADSSCSFLAEAPQKGYLRAEVRRFVLPGLPEIPVMVSNAFFIT